MVIGFFELPEADRPPADIWLDAEAVNTWFERLQHRGDEDMPPDDPAMTANTLTKGLR